jgi:hypothetical protein|uniref:Carboxypeptidase-like regulatory domain-containing protein n=1 Tax=Ignavibacterium album TaxID=591197 RepID=A0A7V3E7R4_9BACT
MEVNMAYKYLLLALFSMVFVTGCDEPIQPDITKPSSTGTIHGRVLKANSDIPVIHALIKTNPPTEEVYTDSSGRFSFRKIAEGEYTLYASCEGFDTDSISYKIIANVTDTLKFKLYTSKRYLEFYPLKIGNYWEYHTGNNPNVAYSMEVVSDTMIKGIKYFHIHYVTYSGNPVIENRYERIDAALGLVYRYDPFYDKELVIDSLAAKEGQKFTCNMFFGFDYPCLSYCLGITEENIFSKLRKVKDLQHFCATDQPRYTLVEGIGIGEFSYFRVGLFRLKYARIDGIEYSTP